MKGFLKTVFYTAVGVGTVWFISLLDWEYQKIAYGIIGLLIVGNFLVRLQYRLQRIENHITELENWRAQEDPEFDFENLKTLDLLSDFNITPDTDKYQGFAKPVGIIWKD